MIDYDRYSEVRSGNQLSQLPFVQFVEHESDKYVEYKSRHNGTRLDILSQKYYKSPIYGFLILMANPEYFSEYDIPDGKIIRIPFPLSRVLDIYETETKKILER